MANRNVPQPGGQGRGPDEDRSIVPTRPTRGDLSPSYVDAREYESFVSWHDGCHVDELYAVLDEALYVDSDVFLALSEFYLYPARTFDEPWWMEMSEEHGGSMWVDDYRASTRRDAAGRLWIETESICQFLAKICEESGTFASGLFWEFVHAGYADVSSTPRERAVNPKWWFRLKWDTILPHWRHGLENYRNRFNPDGYVYILGAPDFYKIGRAKDVDSRVKQLAIQLPWAVDVIHTIPCEDYARSERALHERFSDRRANGEWFLLGEGDLEYIKSIKRMRGSDAALSEEYSR